MFKKYLNDNLVKEFIYLSYSFVASLVFLFENLTKIYIFAWIIEFST